MPPTEKNYSTLLGHKVKSYKPCYEKAVALFCRDMHAVHDKIDFLFAVHDGDKIKNIPFEPILHFASLLQQCGFKLYFKEQLAQQIQ